MAHDAPVATPAPQTMRPTGFELPQSLPSEAPPAVHAPQSTLADTFQEVAAPVPSIEAEVTVLSNSPLEAGTAEQPISYPIGMRTGVEFFQQSHHVEELSERVEQVAKAATFDYIRFLDTLTGGHGQGFGRFLHTLTGGASR